MKLQLDILKSRIITDNPELLEALVELYSFTDPKAYFTQNYKRGYWDGKKRFISKTGSYHTGLTEEILEKLKKVDIFPEIINHKLLNPVICPEIKEVPGFTYYPFQEKLITEALHSRRKIIKAPTGAGKTLISAGLLQSLEGCKTVFLFHQKQILKQTYDFLEKAGFSDLGVNFGEGYQDGRIMLSTVQSIEKIIDTYVADADALFVDEVHEFANGKLALAAINSFPKARWRFGFTATVPKKEIPRYNLIGAFGPVLEAKTTSELVDEGLLTKPVVGLTVLKDKPTDDGHYREIYDQHIVNNKKRNVIIKLLVDNALQTSENPKILILVQSLEHGRLLQELIPNALYLEGVDDLTTRYQVIDIFRKKKGSVLIGTKILQTGINIEEVTHLINARGMKSDIATLQALGRALRKHPTKKVAHIYDFIDQAKYLHTHSLARKRHYEQEGHEVRLINEV